MRWSVLSSNNRARTMQSASEKLEYTQSFHIQSISVFKLNVGGKVIIKLYHVHVTYVYTLVSAGLLGIVANDYCSNYTRDLHMKTPASSLALIIHSVCDVVHASVILRGICRHRNLVIHA